MKWYNEPEDITTNIRSFAYQVKIMFLSYYRSENYRRIFPFIFIFTIFLLPDGNDYARSMIIAGGYRGYYNSAWLGISLSICYNTIIAFFGYYFIKDRGRILNNNTINQVIGSTAVKKSQFVISIFISKFLILLTTLIPVIIIGFITQIIRQESNDFNMIQMFLPYIVFTIPVLLMITSLTFVFDTTTVLKGTIGNITYFIIAYFFIIIELLRLPWSVLGLSCMLNQVCNIVAKILGQSSVGFTIFGGAFIKHKFLFEGLQYTFGLILGRIIIVILSLLVLKIGINNFNFLIEESSEDDLTQQDFNQRSKLFSNIYDILSKLGLHEMILNLSSVKITQKYLFVAFMILSFLSKARFINVMLFLIPMNLLIKLMTYNKEGALLDIVKSTNYYPKQIIKSWLSGLIVLLFANSLVIIRFLLVGDNKSIAVVIAGCSIICSVATLIIEVTNNENLFQILYMFFLYILLDGNFYVIDFTGLSTSLWSNNLVLRYLLISVAIILLLYSKRKLEHSYFFIKGERLS